LHTNCLLKHIFGGKIEGMRRQRRRRKKKKKKTSSYWITLWKREDTRI
jgi:hypothetical protein